MSEKTKERHRFVSFRLNEKEFRKIKRKADAEMLSVSAYIRRRLLGGVSNERL